MSTLNNKYKDNLPDRTIDNIKTFFINLGYTIDVVERASSDNTYSTTIRMLYNGNKILQTNGKGTSDKFALASGLAELYERFCNMLTTISPIYYEYEKVKQSLPGALVYSETNKINNDFIDISNSDYYIGVYGVDGKLSLDTYYNIFDKEDVKHSNSKILSTELGSTGMAAGNSIEEALVQGISEILERIAVTKFVNDKNTIFKAINLSKLENKELVNIINSLNSHGKLFVFDLSIVYHIPVIMSVFIDKKTTTTFCTFGSAPVFDIALERTLTELLQGCDNSGLKPFQVFQESSSSCTPSDYKFEIFRDSATNHINELVTQNVEYIDSYNDSVFLHPGEYSNSELLNYFKQFGYTFYYKDMSLTDTTKSVYIICPQTINDIRHVPNYSCTDYLVKVYNMYKCLLFNKEVSEDIFNDCMMCVYANLDRLHGQQWSMNVSDIYLHVFNLFLDSPIKQIYGAYAKDEIYCNAAKLWLQLKNYLLTDDKVFDKIEFFKEYDSSINKYSIMQCNNPEFLVRKIIVEPYLHFIDNCDIIAMSKPFIEREENNGIFSS